MANELQNPKGNLFNGSADLENSSNGLSVDPLIARHAAPSSYSAQSSGQTSPTVFGSNYDLKVEEPSTALVRVDGNPAKSPTDIDTWTINPENAMNWPMGKKIYHSAVAALTGLCITFGSSVYTPAVEEVQFRFGVSTTVALLPLSVYVWGLAWGPVIGAPLSELFGRRFVYIFTVPLFLIFTIGAGSAQNFTTLVVCRFFAGMLGSPPLAVGAGSNLDLWSARARTRAGSIYLLAPFLGPALGPTVGGFVAQYKDWRWTQWCAAFLGGIVFVFSIACQETYSKIIMKKHAKKLGLPPPASPVPSGLPALKLLLTITVTRPIHMLLTEPIVMLYSAYTAFNFAVIFCFFAAFPIIFVGVYQFSMWQSGLVFVGISAGCAIAVIVAITVDSLTYVRKLNDSKGVLTQLPPETRLYSAMIGSVLLPIGIFWFAWTARADVHWIVPAVATVFFAAGNLLVFISTALYLSDVYGSLNSASALAANGLLRYVLGGVFPLFTVQMYNKLGIHWATSLLGFVEVALLPIPWVFFKFGPQIRAKSQYEVNKF